MIELSLLSHACILLTEILDATCGGFGSVGSILILIWHPNCWPVIVSRRSIVLTFVPVSWYSLLLTKVVGIDYVIGYLRTYSSR